MLRVCCTLLVLVSVARAAAPASNPSSSAASSTKREDPSGPSGGSGGGQPVYSPSASSASYSSAAFDGSDASGVGYKPQQNSQGNLYYYYYPVQDKAQDNAYASSSTHNYATAPANGNAYEGQDSTQNNYHAAAQASDAYASQDAAYAGALNQLSQYGLANGYSLGGAGLGGANAFGGYGASPAGYGAASLPAAYAAGSYPASSAAVGSYAAQPSTLAQYAAQLTGYGGNQYAAASNAYGVPQAYGQNNRRYGLGSLIMPMLALAGLTMLVPTITSNLGSRTKRSVVDPNQKHPLTMITEYKDKLEKYYSLYRTAVEKEECMNRIICEFGTAVSDVKGKGAVVLVLEKLIPKQMRPKMNVFKAGALSTEIGKCKKLFKC